jgi:hypothetical protein
LALVAPPASGTPCRKSCVEGLGYTLHALHPSTPSQETATPVRRQCARPQHDWDLRHCSRGMSDAGLGSGDSEQISRVRVFSCAPAVALGKRVLGEATRQQKELKNGTAQATCMLQHGSRPPVRRYQRRATPAPKCQDRGACCAVRLVPRAGPPRSDDLRSDEIRRSEVPKLCVPPPPIGSRRAPFRIIVRGVEWPLCGVRRCACATPGGGRVLKGGCFDPSRKAQSGAPGAAAGAGATGCARGLRRRY